MLQSRFLIWVLLFQPLSLGYGSLWAQEYPSKAVRIVTAEAGGGSDFAARLIAQGLTTMLGQQVVVENRGGSVVIPAEAVAKAPADGYTLLLFGNTFWLLPFLQDVPYDPARDFAPITLAVSSPYILVVHPVVPARSVKDLIAVAKARPGQLNYGGALPGSLTQLAAELFKSMAGINIVPIHYKGTGSALNALIAGELQLMITPSGPVTPHVRSGRLRGLAVTSAQPSILLPGLPTVAASGLPGFEAEVLTGLFAPARTPAAVINRLHAEISRTLNRPDVREKFFTAGSDVLGTTSDRFGTIVKTDMVKWGKVIKDTGVRAN